MRINTPTTNNEVMMADGQTIITETNLKGVITEANRDFVEISGFSRAELVKHNHNLVRHPDMPAEAFQDLWDTIKSGEPWVGIVKNRCKNGDFYWVEANVTPTFSNGRAIGYLSVRRKPTREQIKAAEELYAEIRNGTKSMSSESRISGLNKWRQSKLSTRMAAQVAGLLAMIGTMAVVAFPEMATDFGKNLLMSGLLGSTILSLGLLRWFHVAVEKPQREISDHLRELAESKFDGSIDVNRRDDIGDLMRRLKCMQVKIGYDVESAKVREEIMSRVQQALQNVNGNVMIADTDLNIVYMNDAVTELFTSVEDDIRNDLPNFDASQLMGTCIDFFHKNPTHQRNLLGALNSEHLADLQIGGRTMTIVANPVFSEDGERLGVVVEWGDRTQEVAIEQEVQNVVDSALRGDLTNRIELAGKSGFFERLSASVNELVGVFETVVGDTARVLGAMADGKLTETIEGDYQGSFGLLKDDTNATVGKLTEVVSKIKTASSSVKGGADEISQGNADLSQRTEEQASSLEETASSMEEMTSTVKQNADNAGEANQLALAAREQAEKGGEVVSQAVDAMSEINASSKKIADIIGVIDEIAFQTNLLALNASVEAARAGDQGRGFAVVASEVRNLAGRSATAAKEIKELIVDSGNKVDDGSRLVNDTGEVLEQIVNGVKKVTDIVGEIAAASREQSAGIDEVGKAIVQLDELTQQNAALVEQAAAASESMGEQADDLNQMMAFFTIGDDEGNAASAVAATSQAATDRRSSGRPWNAAADANSDQEYVPNVPLRQAAGNGGDQEWEEF